jgi:hypothetical protein
MRPGARIASIGAAVLAVVTARHALADAPAGSVHSSGASDDDPWLRRLLEHLHRSSTEFSLLAPAVCGSVLALGSFANTRGSAGGSGGFAWSADTNFNLLKVTMNVGLFVGGGTGGLEGQWTGNFLVGVRGYFDDSQGPFARAGVTSRLVGNDLLVDQYIAPATVDVGYEYVSDRIAVQAALRGAYATSARWGLGDGRRALDDSALVGAGARLRAPDVLLDIRVWQLIPSDGRGLPVNAGTASTCGWWWAGRPESSLQWTVCLDASGYSGGQASPQSSALVQGTGAYAGISFGLGLHGLSSRVEP